MTEEFHDAGKAHASAEHECGVGMSELMWNDPRGDACRSGDRVEGLTKSANQHFPPARPRQKEAVGRRGIERAQESEALHQLADKRIHRNQPFGFRFAERDMNCPFPRSAGVQAIGR
jgi:hypothetical protein